MAEIPSSLGASDSERRRLRLLLVCARWPWPARRGDQLRAVQFSKAMASFGELDLLVPAGAAGAQRPPSKAGVLTYRRDALDVAWGLVRSVLRGKPLQQGVYFSRDLERQLAKRGGDYDLVVLQMVRLTGVLHLLSRRCTVIDLIDALSLNYAKRAQCSGPFSAALWRREASALARSEEHCLASVAGASVVAHRDAHHLTSTSPKEEQDLLQVIDLPIEPAAESTDASEREVDLIFTGNLGYWVNRDALTWWLREVWPSMKRRRPSLTLLIAGSRVPSGVARLSARLDGVALVERPESLRAQLGRARIAIAPMRGGAGVPVKILEAMAEGTPVVASPWAAAGVQAVAGRDLLVAEDVAGWQAHIERVLDDAKLSSEIASNGLEYVRGRHDPERCLKQLTDWLCQIQSEVSGSP